MEVDYFILQSAGVRFYRLRRISTGIGNLFWNKIFPLLEIDQGLKSRISVLQLPLSRLKTCLSVHFISASITYLFEQFYQNENMCATTIGRPFLERPITID